MFACARRYGLGGLGKACILATSTGGIERGFTVIVCRACPDPPCVKVCPTSALTPRVGGGVHLSLGKCIACHNCERACPFKAIFWDNELDKPAVCVYCGFCASFCPYGVIAHEEVRGPTSFGV
ncbi:MAG: 4Fe-4S binding protein [Candidatus Bathyarchaeia archaeon]